MLTYLQAVVLGGLQGCTELFPVSSLGHTVLLPALLHWRLDQHAPFFIIFLVATHLATALVLLGFYWRDWLRMLAGFFRSLRTRSIGREDTYARLPWLLMGATAPAGLLGVLFQEKLQLLFAAPTLVALFLVGNGVLLCAAEYLVRRRGGRPHEHLVALDDTQVIDGQLAQLSFVQAFGIGCMQSLALFPGFSRTGAALAGGLLGGLDHRSALRFSFLLATPIIFAAAVLKLPALWALGSTALIVALVGAVVSGATAYIAVRFLTRYFETRTLMPFALYCVVAGTLASLLLHF